MHLKISTNFDFKSIANLEKKASWLHWIFELTNNPLKLLILEIPPREIFLWTASCQILIRLLQCYEVLWNHFFVDETVSPCARNAFENWDLPSLKKAVKASSFMGNKSNWVRKIEPKFDGIHHGLFKPSSHFLIQNL